ncbi:MAG: hypothetical protein HON70_02815, partial [Lentisphaerae bacterium]|nr:hypothetical protein [Lentisphaerota bacterium]
MPEHRQFSHLLHLCSVWGCLLAAGTAAAAPDDYDRLEVTGKQLLVNGSFEAVVRGHDTPEDWGVYKTVKDTFQLVTDARDSHHGIRYVRFAPPDRRVLYGALRALPSGRHRVTAWVRGDGRIVFAVGAMRDDYRNLPPGEKAFVVRLSSPPAKVANRDWHRIGWEFELPDEFRDKGGKLLKVSPRFSIQVEGDVMFDACSVAPALPAKAVAAKPKAATPASNEAPTPPRIVIPKLAEAPTVDGTLRVDEWSAAVALTGFTILNDRVLSERQAVVYLGYTDSHVYAAFSCPLTGQVKKQAMARDAMGGNETHGAELWLVPPGQDYYQFLTCPGPGKMDARLPDGKAWNGEWEIQDQVVDIPEEIGGILSFRKKLWTAELAVPFETLGVTDPEAGVWRFNVTRNWAAEAGQKRVSTDWTTWTQLVGRFAQPDAFAHATFAPAPAVQFARLGDLANGELRIAGTCRPLAGSVRLTAKAVLPTTGKTLALASTEITAGAPQEFELNSILQTNETRVLDYCLFAEDVSTGAPLYDQRIPFMASAALRLRAVPVFYREELVVEVDTSRIAGLPDAYTLTSRLLRGDESMSPPQVLEVTGASPPADIRHSLAGLAPGEYGIRVLATVPGVNEPLTGAVARFVVPAPQPWYNSELGVTNRVSPPWRPVGVDGNKVRVTEREYRIGNVGLPGQVSALGEELFASPPSLRAVVAGKELLWRNAATTVTKRTDRAVTWELAAKADGLKLTGTLKIEFDGFALWQVQINAPAGTRVDSLSLDFPFHKARSLYARATNPRRSDRGRLVATLNGSGPAEPL